MTNSKEGTKYVPYSDLRLYPGMHLSEERRKQLDEDSLDPDKLSSEDIIYKLSSMVTGTMYGLLGLIEEKWGKQAARDVAFEWGRGRARENLKKWMAHQGVDRLTPEIWAKFQDYRHIISGPIHSPSFVTFEGDSEVVLDRTGCIFHNGHPGGPEDMDSYCAPACDGMFEGYADACPEFNGEMPVCMSRGTSESTCQVRFNINGD